MSSAETLLVLLKLHVHKGKNLAIRDLSSSDPYVIVRIGNEILRTGVVRKNVDPVWDEELTLAIKDPLPVRLEVYDWDRFSPDDKMGDAEFDLAPFLVAVRMCFDRHLPNNTIIGKVKHTRNNCLAEKSLIRWTDGRVVQNMVLRLRNVERGEIEITLSWKSERG